jgi:hypothetical protein
VSAPVDPGEHRIEAKAAGKKPWSSVVIIRADADAQVLDIVGLEDQAPAPRDVRPVVPAPASNVRSVRAGGYATLAVGLAGLVAGSVLGVAAIRDHGDALRRCPDPLCTDAEGVRLNGKSRNEADGATGAIVAGLGVTGIGAVLLLLPERVFDTTPRASAALPRLLIAPPARGAGAVLALDAAW